MLEARDGAIARNRGDERSKSGMAPSRDKEAYLPPTSAASICNLYWSPTWLIDHEEDQGWEPTGDSDSDDDDGGMGLQSNVASDRKVQELLERYLADEEDGEIVRSLVNAGKESEREVGNSGDKKGVEDKYKENLQEDVEAREDDEEREAKGDKEKEENNSYLDSWDKKLLRSGGAAKAEWQFLRRIAAQPRQVLRYAYAGSPGYGIRSRHRRTLEEGARVCAGCGARRVFEMQLMPALLTLGLKTVDIETGAVRRKNMPGVSFSPPNTFTTREEDRRRNGK